MHKIESVNVETLHKWLQDKEVLLIDVREISEYKLERIPEAQNIPLSQICLEDPVLPENKPKKIVMQCLSGVRSITACVKFLESDPSLTIYNLDGGIMAWKKHGYDVIN